ncbi:MAG: hypothetical protein QG559_943 [Campylobacterota bacterium]|nr:hypothetical protein [Campylobacterota bacterium]
MQTDLIVKAIVVLVIVLAILIFFLFLEPSERKKEVQKPKESSSKEKEETQTQQNTDLKYLVSIIKNKKTSSDILSQTLDLIIKHHGVVHKKLGIRAHPDFDIYIDILFNICRHRNATKDMILKFDKELAKLNPDYIKEINEAIARGLESRRV